MVQFLTAKEAVSRYIPDGSYIGVGGFVGGMHPEEITRTMEDLFLQEGHPNNLSIMYAAGQGDKADRGLNHLGHEGMTTCIIGGHWALAPKLGKLASENKAIAYNLPQGVISQLFREIAADRPGLITKVGLHTFVDPRLEGGKLNEKAKTAGDVVDIIEVAGEEYLYYHTHPLDVAIIRATYADSRGNCTFQREGISAETLVIAQAVRNQGGTVIVQVEEIVEYGCLDTRLVKLPGIYVDVIVKASPENHSQTFGTMYNPAFSGEVRVPVQSIPPMKLDVRKVIARRAAMELKPNAITNLGIGMPEGVAAVAAEEELEGMVLTTEAGTIGGVPAGGNDFGMTTNPDCVLDEPSQFDFYDGGGLDIAFLGLAQMDGQGNVNVSKFGTSIPGCGGFIDISQNAKKVVYCGTFTAGGLKTEVADGKLRIVQEGKAKKLLSSVEQVTFSGNYAAQIGQPVLYITERAVFRLTEAGIVLEEIAPGIDIQKDIFDQMDFKPAVSDNLKLMDERIFCEGPMGLTRNTAGSPAL
jgi:propionate CoA-transferase